MKGRESGDGPHDDGIADRLTNALPGGGGGISRVTVFAVVMAAMLVAMPPAAAAGPALDFTDERTPDPYIHEDTLTIAEHNTGDMGSLLEYYDDSGEVAELPATVNSSQDAPAGVRFDKLNAEDYRQFPRVSDETDNGQTWANHSNWTSSSGANSGITVSDADGSTASGVPAVESAGTVASGETATATFGQKVDITSDADKRVLFFVGNVDSLTTGATVEVRAVDSDGDYRYAEVNASADASANDVIANGTGNGFVFQEKLNNLPMAGSGDGAMSSISKVEVVHVESDSTVTIVALDADKKSEYDLGELELDRDGDGTKTLETVQDYHEGGVAKTSGVDTLGAFADGASIMDLEVYDVEYRFSDLTSSGDYQTEFSEAEDYGGYDQMLEVHARLSVPAAIDLSHGTLELRDDQGLVGDRFKTAEFAAATGDTEFGNVSDSSYTDVSGQYASKGETVTLATSGFNPGENTIVHLELALQDDEADAMQSQPAAAGPIGGGGGGVLGFIFSPLGLVTGGVATAVAYMRGWIPFVGA